jgi:ferredoxin
MSQVRVDREVCCAHGLCVAIAPRFFEFDDDDVAVVKDDPSLDDVREAIDACPTQAIVVSS